MIRREIRHAFPEYKSFFIYCFPLICFVALSPLADPYCGLWSWCVLLRLTPAQHLPTSLRKETDFRGRMLSLYSDFCGLVFQKKTFPPAYSTNVMLIHSFMMTDVRLTFPLKTQNKHRNRCSANDAQSLDVAFLPNA